MLYEKKTGLVDLKKLEDEAEIIGAIGKVPVTTGIKSYCWRGTIWVGECLKPEEPPQR